MAANNERVTTDLIANLQIHGQKIYGLLCVSILAFISYFLVQLPALTGSGISSLVMAIILGMILGNSWEYPPSWTVGIQFAAKRLLRTAIVLYGFRVSFQQIAEIGIHAVVIDATIVVSTLLFGFWVGKKLFKLDNELALLISTGAAICGAAAVLAAEDILKSEPYKAAIAIGTVVLFGTASMFLYPLLQHAGWFGFSDHQFGIFAGATVHEVAQALVTGTNINADVGKTAIIVKMIRVLLLVPALCMIGMLKNYFSASKQAFKFTIPWFALAFVLVIAFNSLQLFSDETVNNINQFDIILLTMAMGAIGMETKFSKIKKVGIKPLYLAALLFAWLCAFGFCLVKIY